MSGFYTYPGPPSGRGVSLLSTFLLTQNRSQVGEKEFVDEARAGEANPALLSVRRMGRRYDAATLPIQSRSDIRAVVE
jgi:hypothetical protein